MIVVMIIVIILGLIIAKEILYINQEHVMKKDAQIMLVLVFIYNNLNKIVKL
jgi:hypothetical protein